MLSVLLGTAFLSRQVWGVISDRIGGLATVLIGSAWQAASMTAFLLTQNEVGLFTVAAVFGLGFSGIIPAYVLAVRELFPASEASWKIPTLLLFSGGGMAAGSWLAGLIYDHLGFYAPAFAVGIGANVSICSSFVYWSDAIRRPRTDPFFSRRAPLVVGRPLAESGFPVHARSCFISDPPAASLSPFCSGDHPSHSRRREVENRCVCFTS